MKLLFTERYGNFNWCDKEDFTTEFSVKLSDDDGKTIQKDGVKCSLEWSEDGNQCGNYNICADIPYFVELAANYATRIISSTPYTKQVKLFAETYNANIEQIELEYKYQQGEQLKRKINSLQDELDTINSITLTPVATTDVFRNKKDMFKKWIETEKRNQKDLKKNSSTYEECAKRIKSYEEQLQGLEF